MGSVDWNELLLNLNQCRCEFNIQRMEALYIHYVKVVSLKVLRVSTQNTLSFERCV